jgi:guanosine-3',5'-bis(diphosphate) 3'-pyrophosphohydrolase
VHTEVGHSCVGAKVNGRMVPLRYKLKSGDIVEILTQTGHKPSRDWLALVKSSRSRQKIKHWLNVHQRERAIEIGRKLIEKEARKYRVPLKDISEEQYHKVAGEVGLGRPDDLMAAIGYGKFSARQMLARLAPSSAAEPAHEAAPEEKPGGLLRRVFGGESGAITVRGHDDLLVYRARCCNPIRGEEIVGYVTRGKGVAVHARSCPNVVNLMYESDRRIDVEWAKPAREDGSTGYPVKLTVFCDDRSGMLKQMTALISDENINIHNVEARTANSQATVDFVIDIEDLKHLERIVGGLRKIAGVHDVQRVQKI